MDIFKERLKNILNQLTSDQQEELLEMLFEEPRFQPAGYPWEYDSKTFEQLAPAEIKFLHDRFITIQYSSDPTLQGEDIRGVSIYPYKT